MSWASTVKKLIFTCKKIPERIINYIKASEMADLNDSNGNYDDNDEVSEMCLI